MRKKISFIIVVAKILSQISILGNLACNNRYPDYPDIETVKQYLIVPIARNQCCKSCACAVFGDTCCEYRVACEMNGNIKKANECHVKYIEEPVVATELEKD